MGVAVSHSRLLMITQRKADLQLRLMILQNRQNVLARKAYDIEQQISEWNHYSDLVDANNDLMNTWVANNGMSWEEGMDANPDSMPQLYDEIPSGYVTGEINVDMLEAGAELDLMLINQAEEAIEIEKSQVNTELTALNEEEKSLTKLRDNNIKQTFGALGSN